ncbi:helix-turn-helix transcriptional regulator [Mesorhizobium sp. B2-7-3]|uniref:helix-turn-helix domain-containing protein n=1 Tax=Mesorhizobium sp. B2-7-3 TaxID=2589907 RepID=UPI0011285BF1|nr:helix-turn-helix transcriptional regulator [Mesorhizobium sp. B2-7-3]TPJ20145.1 helix-turn-helix transcriptional regulator [Mesorhizobium sp. B2-7-3]
MNGPIFEALKRTLKAKGVTYRELGKRMGVSEPTVKRIFHEKNCKLDRLVEICAAAGVELENVLGSMNRGPGPVNHIAPEIERRLAGRPALLFVFVMLSEKFTPEGIMRSQGLSEASMFLYLRDLEQLGLIALGRGLSAKLLVETPIQWNFEGPLRPLFEMTNKNFIGWAITHIEKEATFVSFSRRMRPETAEMVRREAEELADRARLLAHHDQHTTPEDGLIGYKWTFAFGATPFEAIMPIGPHPRDAGARMEDQPSLAKGRRPLPA